MAKKILLGIIKLIQITLLKGLRRSGMNKLGELEFYIEILSFENKADLLEKLKNILAKSEETTAVPIKTAICILEKLSEEELAQAIEDING